MQKPNSNGGDLILQLLDSAQGRPIQTWRYRERSSIWIGRGEDNDITLADGQISRKHVELVYREGSWSLVSHGRNGTWIDGANVAETELADRTIFRLGSNGPEFQLLTAKESPSSLQTVNDLDPMALDFLEIDQRSKDEQVQLIADSEEFRQLQEEARRLKTSKGGDCGGPR